MPPREISRRAGKIDNPPGQTDFWFLSGDAAAKQQKFDESSKYLQVATDPAGKAKVLLKLGE